MVDLSTVYKVTAKGRMYYYAWRGQGAPRLKSPPGSPEFVRELAAALEARKGGDASTFGGLCVRYKASDDWKGLADKTRKNWAPWIDRIQVEFGALRLAQFDRPQITPVIRAWRDKYKATPRTADVALTVFSRLLSFGRSEGRLSINAVTPIPRLYKGDRSEIIWTDDDIAELAKHASPEIMFAVRLAVLTGLRQADVLHLSWSHVSANAVEVRTRKKSKNQVQGKTALIPLYGALRDLLAEIPKRSPVILTSSDKVPWKTGFGASWNRAVTKAGIDKHFHDLRGTAATKLFKAGFSIREIAGIMAWEEKDVEKIINTYVKRDEVLRDMIRRLDENEARTASAKPVQNFQGDNA
jgi:integrase